MLPHPLTNFEIQSKKIKDGAYVMNLDEYVDVGKHCNALFCNKNEIV